MSNHLKTSIWVMACLLGIVLPVNADILTVPTPYTSVSEAVAAAQSGDIIEIEAGSYNDSEIVATINVDNLTIRGVNGLAHLNADGVTIANAKAIFVTTGDDITIEHVEFSHAAVPDQNGAGIRHEGGLLTIRNCYFHDNEDGILTSNQTDGELFIERTEFYHNGLGDPGYTHNIYVGHIAKFTMQFCYSHHATHGHNVKSRAAENHVYYNRIMDETTGNASYQIDLPNGGIAYLIGNILHQGAQAENPNMISYAAEGATNAIQELYVSGNTLVNDRPSGYGIRLSESPTAIIVNNIFDGIVESNTVYGTPTIYSNNIFGNDNDFVNRSNFDFHLTAGSPAVEAGEDPGAYNGVDLTPVYEYLHPLNSVVRKTNHQLDAGAFEYNDPASDTEDEEDQSEDDGDISSCFIRLIGSPSEPCAPK